ELGALEQINRERICAVDEMHIWSDRDAEAQQAPTLKFQAYEAGFAHLAYIAEERLLLTELYQVAHHAGVEMVMDDCIAMETLDDRVRVQTGDGVWSDARLLVAADGKNSRIRGLAGISVHD